MATMVGEPAERDVFQLPFGYTMANPFSVPWERRAQTASVLMLIFMFLIMPFPCLYYPAKWFFTVDYMWIPLGLYALWWWYDREAPYSGGHPQEWFKNLVPFKWLRDYFPITLHKTAELDPTRNYIMGYHPHGIASVGALVNFATNATGFKTLFPGMRSHLITLVGQFWFPFRRDLIMWADCHDASKESIVNLLTNYGKGHAVVIVVGGASEAADTHQSHVDLTLNKRKGFVKMAIKYGADLVPVFSFGENALYWNATVAPDSFMKRVQYFLKTYAGIPPMVFAGRGIFVSFGLLPYRHPVDTVVGTPIRVTQSDHPTSEEIVELHKKYIDGLNKVFEDNKKKFGIPDDAHLNIVA